jgi:two-component system, OmpR family, phosphate regulon sensor histidine kinase PhoR
MGEGNLNEKSAHDQLERMKANFISNISHEFGTPLASIKGFTSTLLSEENMDRATQRRFLRIIEEETDNLSSLINRVINLSKYEQQDIESSITSFNIVQAAIEVMKSFETEFRIKEISHLVNVPQAITVSADEGAIKEALAQLIGNAVKYSEKGGSVELAVKDQGDDVLIAVSDKGCGISKTDLPNVFSKFYKVEFPAQQTGSIGVGLALASRIVEKHHGKIWIESEIGRGTRISFMIPKNHGR